MPDIKRNSDKKRCLNFARNEKSHKKEHPLEPFGDDLVTKNRKISQQSQSFKRKILSAHWGNFSRQVDN